MDRKRSKGRQKIAIKRISKESDCFATFSKRRVGLFRKASELSTLCNVDIGVLIYSPTGKPFSFFHPTMESVMHQFQDPTMSDDTSRLIEAYSRKRVDHINQMLDKISGELEAEEEREKQLEVMVCDGYGASWWDEAFEGLNKEELKHMGRWMKHLQSQFATPMQHIHSLSPSSWFPPA